EAHRIAVSISGQTLSHGSALNFGGAIANLSFSSLTLSRVTLSDNHSLVLPGFDDGGGAVFNASTGAELTVTERLVVHNTAEGAAGALTVGGGGIFNAFGSITVSNSVLTDNLANASAGQSSVGGGIFDIGGGLSIDNSSITDNQALGG